MKRGMSVGLAAVLGLAAAGLLWQGGALPAAAQRNRDFDYYPELAKKIVPIVSAGSNLNIGAAQVVGEERDVAKVKVVAQFETDYKDVARIKILVPIQSEKVVQNIDRVPGVSVSAIADYNIK